MFTCVHARLVIFSMDVMYACDEYYEVSMNALDIVTFE
jgi:hypothetical protein